MRKILVLLALILASCQARAQIPPLTGPGDPSQLIATINRLVAAINATPYSQAFPMPASGSMTTDPNSLLLTSAASGSTATITLGTTADANASLGISPNGTGDLVLFTNAAQTGKFSGYLQFASPAQYIPRTGLAACPGWNRTGNQPLGDHRSSMVGNRDHIRGFLAVKIWDGSLVYIPTC